MDAKVSKLYASLFLISHDERIKVKEAVRKITSKASKIRYMYVVHNE